MYMLLEKPFSIRTSAPSRAYSKSTLPAPYCTKSQWRLKMKSVRSSLVAEWDFFFVESLWCRDLWFWVMCSSVLLLESHAMAKPASLSLTYLVS